MSALDIAYRLTVYDTDGTTPLTPHTNAPHSDPLQVATVKGVTGFQPYLDLPRGRKGRLDLLDFKIDIGKMTFRLLDKRTTEGGSNLSRWVTGFIGDSTGRPLLLGKKVLVEERDDGTWSDYFTGEITNVKLGSKREWIELSVAERGEALKAKVFGQRPHPDVTYADSCSLLPYGPAIKFGGFEATPLIPGTVEAWSHSGFGSGFQVVIDRSQVVTRSGIMVDVTKVFPALDDAIGELPEDGTKHNGMHVDLYTTADPPVLIGTYQLARIKAGEESPFMAFERNEENDLSRVKRVGLAELDASHPRYAAMPADATAVVFRVVSNSEPTDDAPIYVDTKSPVDFAADVLDGNFSRLNLDKSKGWSIDRDTSAFTALDQLPAGRWAIKEKMTMKEFLEKVIGKPHRIAYAFNGSGELYPIDVRLPSSSSGAVTIDNDDLFSAVPQWSEDLAAWIGQTAITYYKDHQTPVALPTEANPFPAQEQQTWIHETSHTREKWIESPNFGRTDPYEVDALGIRHSVLPFAPSLASDDDLPEDTIAERQVEGLHNELATLFSGALAATGLRARRNATTRAVSLGDLLIVDVDEIPDAASNLRGGARLGRCIEAWADGEAIILGVVDLGANVVAVAPSVGTLALTTGRESEAVNVPITLNAAGEPAVVHFAITDTATASAPAETSALWTFGGRLQASATLILPGLPSGRRIWVRARTEPRGSELKLPSGWVFPATPSIDTTGLTAPSGLTATVDGSDCNVTFTPGEADLPTEMWLKKGAGAWKKVKTLPPGSTLAPYRDLEVASYTAGLQHRDPHQGASSRTEVAFTIGSLTKSPDMVGATLVVGTAG